MPLGPDDPRIPNPPPPAWLDSTCVTKQPISNAFVGSRFGPRRRRQGVFPCRTLGIQGRSACLVELRQCASGHSASRVGQPKSMQSSAQVGCRNLASRLFLSEVISFVIWARELSITIDTEPSTMHSAPCSVRCAPCRSDLLRHIKLRNLAQFELGRQTDVKPAGASRHETK